MNVSSSSPRLFYVAIQGAINEIFHFLKTPLHINQENPQLYQHLQHSSDDKCCILCNFEGSCTKMKNLLEVRQRYTFAQKHKVKERVKVWRGEK